MLSISVVKSAVTNTIGRTGLILQKRSPEIMLALGITGIPVAMFLTGKATLKAAQVNKEHVEMLVAIDKASKRTDGSYTEKDRQRDLTIAYLQTGAKYLRLYGPAILVAVGSVGLIAGSHHILNKRNAALAAAYEAVSEGFKMYRDRVKKELGEDADRRFRFGELLAQDDEPPWEVGDQEGGKDVKRPSGFGLSPYARIFDQNSIQYQKSYELNEFMLRNQQNRANDMLQTRGHVFLNEVYDLLELPRSKEGTIVGWVKGQGDNCIDFGIWAPGNERKHPSVNQKWFLDFNVQGTIFDKI